MGKGVALTLEVSWRAGFLHWLVRPATGTINFMTVTRDESMSFILVSSSNVSGPALIVELSLMGNR